MKKNLAVRLVFIFLALILYSCRTDESVREEERADQEKIMAFVKFHEKSTVSRFADEGSYAYPFAEIIENYFYNHPDYAGMFIKDVGTIDLQVASQTFLDGEEKIVLFPILEDEKVTAIIQCTVNADETYVSFKVLKTEVPADMQDAIRDFQEYYDNKTSETAREKSIQEVIITIYLPRNWTGSGIDYNPWGSNGSGAGGTMNGGSGIHGSGGSGNSGSQNQNPCEKTKAVINKSNIQAGINNVKAQAKLTLTNPKTGEIGFKEKKDGTVVPADVSGAHHAVFNNVTDGYGGYHNHTATGIHMVSPPDIADALFGFAAAQSISDGVGNAYLGMIAAETCSSCPDGVKYVHYLIRYAGTGAELANFVYSPAQMKKFNTKYAERASDLAEPILNGTTYINSSGNLNEKGLEKLFFDTLTNMGLDNKVVLQRIENNGAVYNVTKNSSGIITATPCP